MIRHRFLRWTILTLAIAAFVCGFDPGGALAKPVTTPGSTPDYFETANWAYSPPLRKFVDGLPLLCGGAGASLNNLGQCIPVAIPDQSTYAGSDYYEIEVVEYLEQMHSDLPPVVLGSDGTNIVHGDPVNDPSGGTRLRGYRQVNTTNTDLLKPHYLGPMIVAQKNLPVRIKLINKLPTGSAGNLFIPVDTTIMGSGPGPKYPNGTTCDPEVSPDCANFPQNRALFHLHGGRTPWISDGTPHQWVTPAGEVTPFPRGASAQNVPDMPDPGSGSLTYYYTNQQSARLLFYHDHAWGITRLNVYIGEAAGYLIQDQVEHDLVDGTNVSGANPSSAKLITNAEIPLVIQDKTFVDPATITATDPTWAWGSQPWNGTPGAAMTPVKGDLWWPHVYMPAQNPFNPDLSGVNPMGRWHYGPWFYPATPVCGTSANAVKPLCIDYGVVPNPYYDPNCVPDPTLTDNNNFCQPPEIPGTPNVSWGAEAFLDTMTVNGTAYPTVTLDPKEYRFRILNASHDRFMNLQLYQADGSVPAGCPTCAPNTEVKMVPAAPNATYPANWPADGREGGVPDPATRGPAWIQIGSESGFLPAPVLLPNQPVKWNVDPTMFNVGNVLQQSQGGGTLFLGPAERADVIVDFSKFAGKTLIVYNDAPTAFPALDPHYDYYTGAPDRQDIGGAPPIPVGQGPNIRTVMQIKINAGPDSSAPVDDYNPATLAALETAFKSTATTQGVFAVDQDPIVVGQTAYNSAYNTTFPATWPYYGLSRISDTSLSFKDTNGITATNIPMIPKAIHDEMGATFDDYGRMSAKLGLEVPFVNAATANFILQNYVDPATEIVVPGGIQIWKITHNGVDTHPIHFHLFDVQVLNRVGWDGFIRLPDPNELGWKETVRISPLEDTIVALRPVAPTVPFALPDSVRLMNPAFPVGSTMGFSNVDTQTGGALVPPTTNQEVNFGKEYVWHCHILSHEENDMMRPVVFRFPTSAPETPSLATPTTGVQSVVLTWTQSSVTTNAPTGFVVLRRTGTTGDFSTLATINYSTMLSYTDTTVDPLTTYAYRVYATNAIGDSPVSIIRTITTSSWTAPTATLTATPATGAPPIVLDATVTAGGGTITKVEFYNAGILLRTDTTAPYSFSWTNMAAGTYSLTAKVYNSLGATAVSAPVTVTVTSVPSAPTAISPQGGGIATTPTYTFTAVTGATDYMVYGHDNTAGTDFNSGWVTPAAAGCPLNTGTCGISFGTPLIADHSYTWIVSGRNAAGQGPWSNYLTFSTGSLPVAPTAISPQGGGIATTPTYTFSPVTGATDYMVYGHDNTAGTDFNSGWVTPEAAGCPLNTGTCGISFGTPLIADHSYTWIVSGRNAAGQGPWSNYLTFSTGSLPVAPTAISPQGGGIATTPTYTFSPVTGATDYMVYGHDNTAGTDFNSGWVTPEAAGCPLNTGTCGISFGTPLTAAHSYTWIVSGRNAAGQGPWSNYLTFDVQ